MSRDYRVNQAVLEAARESLVIGEVPRIAKTGPFMQRGGA